MHATSSTFTSPDTPTCEVPSNGVVEISLLPVCTGETSISTRSSYPEAISTLHCALENGADLHVNEPQKTEERRRRIRKKKNPISRFFTLRGATRFGNLPVAQVLKKRETLVLGALGSGFCF